MFGFTLEQIRAATKAQIINWITDKLNNMTKKQIIELVMEFVTVSRKPEITYRPDGQVASRLDVEQDVLAVKVGSVLTTHSYYPGGEIDEIAISERDANDAEIRRRVIKHYLDGRQPTAEEV